MDDGHRICIAQEHDPRNGKCHGTCVRCGHSWPCEAENQWQRIRDYAEQTAAQESRR